MLNNLCLQGRLIRDPETKDVNGRVLCKFTLVQDQPSYGGKEAEGLFLDVAAWGQTGEFVSKFFRKGKEAVVEGRLSCRSYTDREGQNRKAWTLEANRVHFCGPKQPDAFNGGNRVDMEVVSYEASDYTTSASTSEIDPFADSD